MGHPWLQKLFGRTVGQERDAIQSRADDGDAEAQFSLGLVFATGCDTQPDLAQAARWYLKAATQNHAGAQFNLGLILAGGQGIPRDEPQATLWICRAANQGHAAAQHTLGSRCRRASFKEEAQASLESNLEAYKWFRLAAAQGNIASLAASETIALGLTREQVVEGDQRVASFLSTVVHAVQA